METIRIENLSNLPAECFEAIRQAVQGHSTMERALAWYFSHTPPLVPENLVSQDEFSYDLLVPFREGLWLSYDTS